jgi:hypothetical protein
VKKQEFQMWAVEDKTEYLAFTSLDVRPLLFGLQCIAKKHLRVGDADDPVLVRVTIEPIKKPKRARGEK